MIRRFAAMQPVVPISENPSRSYRATCGSTEKEAGGIHGTLDAEKTSRRARRDGGRT
ncbi:hypothetical protein SAMN05216533_2131 [Streptomyces sp. Ag109_O5-10]|nr:hypothetical protein SAMN05216533_2131 [Streptomyces sp. Ag109_O5-10]